MPGLLVGVGLRDGAVRLVRAGRGDALVLVVDARGRIEQPLEPVGAVERRRAPEPVHVAHRLRDLDLGLHRDLLADQLHREDRREVVRPGRLHRARVQRRQRLAGQVGEQVDPVGRDAVLGERELGLGGHAAILTGAVSIGARMDKASRTRLVALAVLLAVAVPLVIVALAGSDDEETAERPAAPARGADAGRAPGDHDLRRGPLAQRARDGRRRQDRRRRVRRRRRPRRLEPARAPGRSPTRTRERSTRTRTSAWIPRLSSASPAAA